MKIKFHISDLSTILIPLAAALLFVGCAVNEPMPVKSLSDAEAAIGAAKDSDAAMIAPLDIRIAEEKLQKANAAVAKKDYPAARRLADEAAVDAKIADAKSGARKLKSTEKELNQSIEALQKELDGADGTQSN